ncbi:hypothetical protein QSJ18_10810 [Gordonia sp. ABSL1-1]|uniref:hypothetical protein n=1 Tax=Gordonia sp. ABSL1-1 TaxID=3053923 RepID=UPI002572BE71|nr:hypothetical protein [Gordonia sp. ABSL1-1]MDL9937234.1 hypothetical protein [Gordonia sp. ABSL1-1]
MKILLAAVGVVVSAVTATTIGSGTAAASPAAPTTGDLISYRFFADSGFVGITYYDADNRIRQLPNTRLPDIDPATGWYTGTLSFRSRSTYQSAIATVQTQGSFAACSAAVNGESSALSRAQGRHAITSCS